MPDDNEDLLATANEIEEEEGPEEESEEEESEEDEPAAAAPPVVATSFVRQKKEKKRKRDKTVDRTSNQAINTAPAVSNDGTKNLAAIWNEIVESVLPSMGMTPSQVWIQVRRGVIGALRTPANAMQNLTQIDGSSVCGIPGFTTPGEELEDHILNGYHMVQSPPAPARYKVTFNLKTGSGQMLSVPEGELILGDPKEIHLQREAVQRLKARRDAMIAQASWQGSAGVGSMPSMPYPIPNPGMSMFRGYNAPTEPAPAPAPAPVPAAPPAVPQYIGASPELEATRRELEAKAVALAAQHGMYEERARQEGLQAQRAAIPTAAPSQDEQDARTAAIVARTLQGMGFTPEAMQRIVAPRTPIQQAQVSPSATGLGALREAFTLLREVTQIKDDLRDMLLEDEPEPEVVVPPPPPQLPVAATAEKDPFAMEDGELFGMPVKRRTQKPDEGIVDYLFDHAKANPMLVGRAAQVLGQIPAVKNAIAASPIGSAIAAAQGAAGRLVEAPPANGVAHTNGAPAATGFTAR